MATISRDFDGYKLWYFSNDDLFAMVHCYKGPVFTGRISFFKEGNKIPPNANLANGPSIHFAGSRFNDVMTILNQERPLYLFLDPDTLSGMVANTQFERTGEEEVGAEELRGRFPDLTKLSLLKRIIGFIKTRR